jgi:hypothetical protein
MGFMPVCHSCESRLGLKKKDQSGEHLVPPEVMPMIYSAKSAAEEVGAEFELIDISKLPITKRLRMLLSNKPIPRVCIGTHTLAGIPTTQDIIDAYHSIER